MAAVGPQGKETSSLNDKILLPETKSYSRTGSGSGSGFSPVGSSWSSLSSPFGSEFGSTTETESEAEDDEFMAELTRKMADYMLDDDDDDVVSAVEDSRSEKFRVSSSECSVTPIAPRTLQPFVDEQEQKIHLCKRETQPSLKTKSKECKQGASKASESSQQPDRKNSKKAQNRAAGVFGSAPVVWQPPQMHYGSGMRAVFLGGPTPKARTGGTGVFLPRAASNPPEVRKKLGCSTVLIPTRVLQTLQLHFEKVKNQSQSNGSAGLKSYPPQYDLNSPQAQRQSQTQSHSANKTPEICLPQEWTY